MMTIDRTWVWLCLVTLAVVLVPAVHSQSVSTIDVPGATDTFARSINNSGEIVGYFLGASGLPQGFLLSRGTFTPLNVPGAEATVAEYINDSGQVIGLFEHNDGIDHGFLFSAGSFTTFDFPLTSTSIQYASSFAS